MKPYIVSLGAGLLVGIIYALIKVRSPAPPAIALVGLLGILIGEQLPPLVKHLLGNNTNVSTWLGNQFKPHVLGEMPKGQDTDAVRAPSGS